MFGSKGQCCIYVLPVQSWKTCWRGMGGGNRGEEPRRKEAGGVREGGVDGVGSEIPKVARSWRNSGKIIMQHCTTFCNKKKCKTKKAEPTKIGW